MNLLEELVENGKRMEKKLDDLTTRLDKVLERSSEEAAEGTMTDRDLNHILMQDDIIAGIDAWNASRGHRRGKRRAA